MRFVSLQTCTRPLHEMLINDTFSWIACSHALNSGGLLVVGTFVYASFFAVLLNWTESIYPPMVWTALSSSVVFSFLPGSLAMRLVGLISIIVATGVVMLWQAWRR